MEEKPRILVVDDEARSVELLARALRLVGEVETATSGDEAWEKFQKSPFELVICDQRMPGMKGAEFLARVAESSEHTARVLLTGYADMEATISAINKGRIHAYINKPWSPDELAVSAKNLVERVRLEQRNKLLVAELSERNEDLEVAMAELRRAQEQLLQGERLSAVARTLATMTLHFQGPLETILSATGELAREDATPTPQDRVGIAGDACSAAERLLRTCGELLDLTRLNHGSREPQQGELEEVLHSVIAAVGERAGQSGVVVEAAIDPSASLAVNDDAMRRAVLHLVENAIEAMPEGGVLEVESRREDDDVVVRIDDNGVGIPEAIARVLFEPFVSYAKPGHLGLGLAIVRKVAEDHGGEAGLAKDGGAGSAFEIRLPLAR